MHTHTQPPLVLECLSFCALLCSSALPSSLSPSFSLVREIRHLQQFFLSSGGIQLCHLSLSDFLVAGISIKEFLLWEKLLLGSVPGRATYFLLSVS